MIMMERPFRLNYGPLVPKLRQIRLLTLQPASRLAHQLRCDISVYPIDEAPPYEALSYCWGDPAQTRVIIIGGQQFGLSENLYQSLLHLRRQDQPRILWIDAICINQRSLKEKSHQIPLMAKIFSCATQVVAWLGVESDNIRSAFQIINQWSELWREHAAQNGFDRTDLYCKVPDLTALSSELYKSFDEPSWNSIAKFFERAYWTRLWVIQEIVLAKSVIIQISWENLPFRQLLEFICLKRMTHPSFETRTLAESYVMDRCVPAQLMGLVHLFHAKDVGSSTLLDIPHLLYLTKTFDCKDPRDKLYAIHGLASLKSTRCLFTPDYEKEVNEIFTRFAVDWILATKRLDILAHTGIVARGNHLSQTSWIINDNNIRNMTGMGEFSNASLNAEVYYYFSSDYRYLSVSGIICAEILQIFRPVDGYVNTLKSWFEQMDRFDGIKSSIAVPKLQSFFRLIYSTFSSADTDLSLDLPADVEIFIANTTTFCLTLASILSDEPGLPEMMRIFKQLINDIGLRAILLEAPVPKSLTVTSAEENVSEACIPQFSEAEVEDLVNLLGHISLSFASRLSPKITNRDFFITREGYMGLCNCNAIQLGDSVCIVAGCKVPLIIRRVASTHHVLVGDCEVMGMMHGEIVAGENEANVKFEHIVLR